MCEQQRRATVGERVSSRVKTLSGAKPCLFSGNVALGSPKWGLCFHGCVAQHRLGFAHLAVMSMVVFRFFVFAIGLLRRFLYPILDPLAFAPNTFYTHNLSKYGLFQGRFQYGLFQNHGLHTCFGLNLNRGLNKTNVLASTTSFTQRAFLHNTALSTNTMFCTKTMFLLGLCKGCLQPTG